MIGKERDFELLSAYVDGELTESERIALESRLRVEPDLQAEFAALQHTIALIRQLPLLRAPRNYTLDPAQFHSPKVVRPRWGIWASAVAAVLVAVFGLVYLLSQGGQEDSSGTTVGRVDTAQIEVTNGAAVVQQTGSQTAVVSTVIASVPAEVAMAAQQPTMTTVPLQPTLSPTVIPTQTFVPPAPEQLGGANQPPAQSSELIPDSMMPPSSEVPPGEGGGAGGGGVGAQEFESGAVPAAPPGMVDDSDMLPQEAQRATQLGTDEQEEDFESDSEAFSAAAVEQEAPLAESADDFAAESAPAFPGDIAQAPNVFKFNSSLGQALIRRIIGVFDWLR